MTSSTKPNLQAAFAAVTTLFFAWGFITSMIDPLIPSVRAVFRLTYAESMLTQLAFFLAYGVVSLPAAALVARLGYSRSVIGALGAMLVGCLIFPLATKVDLYQLVLLALFVIASGITVLQVAANPLAAALGVPERSHLRLTLSQAFNSLGTVIGPYLGSTLMLRGGMFDAADGKASAAALRTTSLRNIDTSFLLVAALIGALALFIWGFRRRLAVAPPPAHAQDSVAAALRSNWAVLGAGAIFLYVGAEVSVGSNLINFLHQADVQIYSNHTSSSIAQGSGAMAPVYLQTAEAYQEYFSHLTPNGVLHINHYGFPREISTAALAWKNMGRTDFRKHVVLFFSPSELTLPTLLIKMSPWTPEEVAELSAYLAPPELDIKDRLVLMENPLDPSKSFLSDDFYSGSFPTELAERMPVDFTPRTDDNPYFSVFRKHIRPIKEDPKTFVDPGTVYMLNASLQHGLPMDQIHLWITGGASLLFALVFILAPLKFSKVGREEGATALPLLAYFSCLGAGFITLELVFIQKFMQLIGSPLYTYSTVIFTMLLGAGIGSASSERLGITTQKRWTVPFIAILALGLLLIAIYPPIAKAGLAFGPAGRAAVAAAMIFPLGFFLGMPFPLGILAIERQPRGAIAWAWGMNGLFTVIGGLASVISGLVLGFNLTIVIALVLYAGALALFRKMRDIVPRGATAMEESKDPPVMTPSYDAPWQPGAAARNTQSRA